MKILFRAVLWLVALVVLAAVALISIGSLRLAGTIDVPDHAAPAPATSAERIEEGRRLADALVCAQCHGQNLAGTDFLDGGGSFMRLPAPNLTGGRISPEALERAVRHGVRLDGSALLIMPSSAFAEMTDEDLAALAGYIVSLPDTPSQLMVRSIGPIGRAVAAFQASEIQPARHTPQLASHQAAGRGAVARYTPLCVVCHGADFGGQVFKAEVELWAPNLTDHATGAGSWTLEQFGRALRQGETPDGRTLRADEMPWQGFSSMSDQEVEAIYDFLRELPSIDRPRPKDFA
jgi:mono/diheme cytochrome c family protein